MEVTRQGGSEGKDVFGTLLKFRMSVQRVQIPSGQSADPQGAGTVPGVSLRIS